MFDYAQSAAVAMPTNLASTFPRTENQYEQLYRFRLATYRLHRTACITPKVVWLNQLNLLKVAYRQNERHSIN